MHNPYHGLIVALPKSVFLSLYGGINPWRGRAISGEVNRNE